MNESWRELGAALVALVLCALVLEPRAKPHRVDEGVSLSDGRRHNVIVTTGKPVERIGFSDPSEILVCDSTMELIDVCHRWCEKPGYIVIFFTASKGIHPHNCLSYLPQVRVDSETYGTTVVEAEPYQCRFRVNTLPVAGDML